MSKRQLKKILTVLGGVVSILFLALLVNNYFNIYLFLGSIFLNCCNVGIKNNKRENNNVREYSNRSCNKNANVTYRTHVNCNKFSKTKVRVRRKD